MRRTRRSVCLSVSALLVLAGEAPAGEIILTRSNPLNVSVPAWPVTISVPFPAGTLPKARGIALLSASVVSALSAARWPALRRTYRIPSADHGALLAPQTFFCFSLSAFHPLRPRAPPTIPAQRINPGAAGSA